MGMTLLIVVLIIGAIILLVLKNMPRTGVKSLPYQRSKALFTPAERSFLGVLDQAVGAEYRVFGKVRLADVVTTKPGMQPKARNTAFNKIAAKHFDFIICRADDLSVACVVELNDKSHAGKAAQVRDQFKADVCKVAGLPLLSIPAKAGYPIPEVRARFISVLTPLAIIETPASPEAAKVVSIDAKTDAGGQARPVRRRYNPSKKI